jgi:hypothetical protein
MAGFPIPNVETIFVISDSYTTEYQHNRPYNFKNKVIPPIQVKGQYEIAPVALQYDANWINQFSDEYIGFLFRDDNGLANPSQNTTDSSSTTETDDQRYEKCKNEMDRFDDSTFDSLAKKLKISMNDPNLIYRKGTMKKGQYTSVEAIASAVSKVFKEAFQGVSKDVGDITFQFNKNTYQFSVKSTVSSKIYIFGMLGHIFDKLGYYDDKAIANITGLHGFLISKNERIAEAIAKLDTLSTMFILSDLVQLSHVGDKLLPVLGSVPIPSDNFGTNQFYSFNPLEFKPITASQLIEEIDIRLVTDNGYEPFPISSGKVQVKLLLRPRKFLE